MNERTFSVLYPRHNVYRFSKHGTPPHFADVGKDLWKYIPIVELTVATSSIILASLRVSQV